MTKKNDEPEVQVRTSFKSLLWFAKGLAAVLGATGAGVLGGTLGQGQAANAAVSEERIATLENNCQHYDNRLVATETKVDGMETSLIDIKRDIADIRTTNVQILLILRRGE